MRLTFTESSKIKFFFKLRSQLKYLNSFSLDWIKLIYEIINKKKGKFFFVENFFFFFPKQLYNFSKSKKNIKKAHLPRCERVKPKVKLSFLFEVQTNKQQQQQQKKLPSFIFFIFFYCVPKVFWIVFSIAKDGPLQYLLFS